ALPAATHWRPRRTRRLASAGSSSRPIPRRGDGLQRPLTGGGRVPLPQAAWQAAVGEPGTAPYGARRSSRASEAAGPGRLKARSMEQITDTALASSASGTPSTGTRRGVRGEDLGGAAAAGSTAALDRCRRDAAVGRRARIAALGEAVVGEVVGSGPRGGAAASAAVLSVGSLADPSRPRFIGPAVAPATTRPWAHRLALDRHGRGFRLKGRGHPS